MITTRPLVYLYGPPVLLQDQNATQTSHPSEAEYFIGAECSVTDPSMLFYLVGKFVQMKRKCLLILQTDAYQAAWMDCPDNLRTERVKSLGETRTVIASFLPKAYTTYEEYVASHEWAERRRKYYETHPKVCALCRSLKPDLHHKSYAEVGHEADADLIPLCKACHARHHETTR